MILAAEVIEVVRRFNPSGDGSATKSRELTLLLLTESIAPFSRDQFTPGHITCTGLVLSPGRDLILLVLHRRLQRWLLPGGHVEVDDASIANAGRREVVEETGAILMPERFPLLVGVDVHGIPSRKYEPYHLHHDLIFRFQAVAEDCRPNEESREVLWCGATEFDRYDLPESVRLAYARAVADGAPGARMAQ
ncbi:MAG: NUDIX domain-containing protein [Bryobacteraceae bacterium]